MFRHYQHTIEQYKKTRYVWTSGRLAFIIKILAQKFTLAGLWFMVFAFTLVRCFLQKAETINIETFYAKIPSF